MKFGVPVALAVFLFLLPAAICAALVRNNDDAAELYRFVGWYFVWLQAPVIHSAFAWLVLRPIAIAIAACRGMTPFGYPTLFPAVRGSETLPPAWPPFQQELFPGLLWFFPHATSGKLRD